MTIASQLAGQLLLAVKKQLPTLALRQQLAAFHLSALRQELSGDNQKLAFWINSYNAWFQLLRTEHGLRSPDIYRQRIITLAGETFSLDDIEHGVLRCYRYKRPPGQFSEVFKPELIRSLMVGQVDGRIHFALNCGAASCPPIAFYQADKIMVQLKLATRSFLEGETSVDVSAKMVTTTALLDWYAEDFGGRDGVRTLLSATLELDLTEYTIYFREYSWEEALHNFVEE